MNTSDKPSTLRAQMKHHEPIVCYSIEGHIVDRETAQNGKGWAEGYAHTLNSTDRHAVCYAIDSHPQDNRFRIDGEAVPTLSVKIAKGSADGPLVLVSNENLCCRDSFTRQQDKDQR